MKLLSAARSPSIGNLAFLDPSHRIGRRAKYILIQLDDGMVMVIHLGMSGRIVIDDRAPPGAHDHVVFETDEGVRVTFNDARRFGLMTLVRAGVTNCVHLANLFAKK